MFPSLPPAGKATTILADFLKNYEPQRFLVDGRVATTLNVRLHKIHTFHDTIHAHEAS